MDNRKRNEEYQYIGNDLIERTEVLEHIKNSAAKIVFLESEAEKKASGKVIYGQCEKVANKYKWGIPCDFTITVFKPNVKGFTPEQIEILLLHELLHVGIDFNADGTEKHYIKPHDLEDFRYIVDRYGTEWDKDDQITFNEALREVIHNEQ